MNATITPGIRPVRWLLLLLPLLLAACSGTRTPSTGWPGLSVDEQRVYVAFNQAVYAVSLEDGREEWRYSPQEEQATTFYAPPAVDREAGTLYVGTYDGHIVALNAESGATVWRREISSGKVIGGPALAGDLLIVPTTDRQLHAIRTDNGTEVWSFSSERPLWSTPLVEGDRLYLAALDHHLYALDSQSGELVWERDLSGALADRPVSFNGALLVGSFSEELNAVDKQTGEVAWSVATEDWVWGNPAIGEGTAYFGDLSGEFFAVDENGRILWQLSLDSAIAASPAYRDGRLYFVTEGGTESGQVFAREAASNNPLWEKDPVGRLLSDPIATDNGLLLVAALEGENLLTAYNAESGAIRWTYQPAED
jgi:outer membrane protein assembly factor BamB